MKILMLDNYDSFTYNLVQYIQDLLGRDIDVYRNDALTLDQVAAYDIIILSPGPGLPSGAGIMPAVLQAFADRKRILGVCLGHQAIGEAFGARLKNLEQVYHGVETPMQVTHPASVLFQQLPPVFPAGRYHSWVLDRSTLPECLVITAQDSQGEIMGLRHRDYDVFGVQFHPESVMTPDGKQILENFLSYCGALPALTTTH